MIEIINIKGDVIFRSNTAKNTKEAVEEAVRLKVSLAYADLNHFDLSFGNFKWGDFKCAQFCFSNLRGADFSGAILAQAWSIDSNLSDAIFSEEGLRDAITSYSKLYDDIEAVKKHDILFCGTK